MRVEDRCLKGIVHIPTNIRLIAATSLDQQMWCWGCDVRRTQGNLMLAYGAQKRPAPTDLLLTTLNWIGGYERWLRIQVEPEYRERVLAVWPQRKRHKGGVPAVEMPARWLELAEQIVQNRII